MRQGCPKRTIASMPRIVDPAIFVLTTGPITLNYSFGYAHKVKIEFYSTIILYHAYSCIIWANLSEPHIMCAVFLLYQECIINEGRESVELAIRVYSNSLESNVTSGFVHVTMPGRTTADLKRDKYGFL